MVRVVGKDGALGRGGDESEVQHGWLVMRYPEIGWYRKKM